MAIGVGRCARDRAKYAIEILHILKARDLGDLVDLQLGIGKQRLCIFDSASREICRIVDARLLPEQAAEIGWTDVQALRHAVE